MNFQALMEIGKEALPLAADFAEAMDDGQIDNHEAIAIGIKFAARVAKRWGKGQVVIDMSIVEGALVEAGVTVVHSRLMDDGGEKDTPAPQV